LASKAPSCRAETERQLTVNGGGGSLDLLNNIVNGEAGIDTFAYDDSYPSGNFTLVLPASGEHWSNVFPWLGLRARGVDVRRAPLAPDGAVPPEALAALVDARTRVVAVAHVSFSTGARCDLRALSAAVKAANPHALLVVDGIQGAGAVPLDLAADGVDAYAAGQEGT
jgi:selenocysteine lyase/cysteine desulfurase